MKAVVISWVPPGHAHLAAVDRVLEHELARAGYETVTRFALEELKLGFCQGEFDCWLKTPGRCKIHDAEQEITRAIPQADALVVLGPIAFGGHAHMTKRAIDRLICLISPFFEQRHALTHHEPRYRHYPRLYSVGWLPSRDPDQEATFDALNDANALNLFAPLRGTASACIAAAFERKFKARGLECRLHYATEFVHDGLRSLDAARSIAQADLFVLATPLYVDSLPALVTHALELVARAPRPDAAARAFVPFINCGFPEPEHIRTALRITRHFARAAGYRFAGGLPLGAGGIVTPERSLDEERPPVAHVVRTITLAADALASGSAVPASALESLLHGPLPEALYRLMGDLGFRWRAHALGTSQRELRARPFEPKSGVEGGSGGDLEPSHP